MSIRPPRRASRNRHRPPVVPVHAGRRASAVGHRGSADRPGCARPSHPDRAGADPKSTAATWTTNCCFLTSSPPRCAPLRGRALGSSAARLTIVQGGIAGYAIGIAIASIDDRHRHAVSVRTLGNLTRCSIRCCAIALPHAGADLVRTGAARLIFVLVHSVTWAVALKHASSFLLVSKTLKMVGRRYGLRVCAMSAIHHPRLP